MTSPFSSYGRLASICLVLTAADSTSASTNQDSAVVTISTTMQSKDFSAMYRPELAIADASHRQSHFLSENSPQLTDEFRFTFSRPILIRGVSAVSGDNEGHDRLDSGVVEVSSDGVAFKTIGTFAEGRVHVTTDESAVLAIRIRPNGVQNHPLELRDIDIRFEGGIHRVTRSPRIVFDSSLAPNLAEWGVKAQKVAQDSFAMIMKALPSHDFIGPNYVRIWFNPDYKGVAATSNDSIEISPSYVSGHMDDFGMVVHELTHAVQHYTHDTEAGWLVEGIADYVRFYLYEPNVPRPRINPDKSTYHDAYRTSAAFLAYGQQKYDRNLVRKLNEALRAGTYSDSLFKKFTGKEPTEIWDEFISDLKAGKTKLARL